MNTRELSVFVGVSQVRLPAALSALQTRDYVNAGLVLHINILPQCFVAVLDIYFLK